MSAGDALAWEPADASAGTLAVAPCTEHAAAGAVVARRRKPETAAAGAWHCLQEAAGSTGAVAAVEQTWAC